MSKRVWPEIKPGDFGITYKSRYYTVYGYIGEVDEYIDGKAYINKETEKAYICSKNQPQSSNLIPVVKVNDMNEVVAIEEPIHQLPPDEDPFIIKNIDRVDYNTIVKNSSADKELYDEQALSDMNSATSMYVPTLNDADDPLKKCVKHSLISKGVNTNKYKHSMGTKYGFTNLKAILNNDTKMSIINYEKFMELEECYYMIIVYDKGTDIKNPLKIPLVYSSKRGRVEELTKDDIKQMINMLQLRLSDLECD